MEERYIPEARKYLERPKKLLSIPVQRAATALGVTGLTVGHGKFHTVEYLIYPNNLYLTFDSSSTRDKNGNYDSPIFQTDSYNGHKPLWQELRESAEKKIGTSISSIYFGDYRIDEGNDEFFTVKTEPKECHWRYTKKKDKDSIFITAMTREEAQEYQDILDQIRLKRATRIVKEEFDRKESRTNRENGIKCLQTKYATVFERFTLEEETFRFRQFNREFFYTDEGLCSFDKFYMEVCVPYNLDEIADNDWRKSTKEIEKRLLSEPNLGPEFILCGSHTFRFIPCDDNGCKVECDITDDRTGKSFEMYIQSQMPEQIYNAIVPELGIVFQRKRQARRATATLQNLASKQ
ncbi:hypothetical protein IK146_03765 [Candidatus Saccharibacteria bacterium]|nr:hypothetical protein [Candidatus Saccharibacteria bacterium]